MRKGFVYAAGLAMVALVAALIGAQWMQSRATAEFTRTVDTARSSGVRIEHGTPRVSIWSRTLTVEPVEISMPGDAGRTVRIGRLVAHGVSPSTADLDASRLELTDIEVDHAIADMKDAKVRLKIPSATAEGVFVPGTVGGSGDDQLRRTGAFLERFRARSVRVPLVEAKLDMPLLALPPPGPRSRPGPAAGAGTIDYTYRDIALDRVLDGRIGAMTIGATNFKGAVGSGRIERLEARDIDLMPLFRVGLDRRKPTGAYYAIYGRIETGRLLVSMPQGGEISIGSMLGTGFGIDPDKLSVASMTDITKSMPPPGRPPTPAQSAQVMDAVARIYQGMKFDEFTMRDMRVTNPALSASPMSLGALVMLELVDGKLKQVRLDAIDVPLPAQKSQPVRIGSFALNQLDIVRMMQLGGRADPATRQRGQPPPAPSDVLSVLGGIELRDTVVPDFGSGSYTIEAFRTSWGRMVGGAPADMRLELRGKMPIGTRNPTLDKLRERGITEISGDIDIASIYREATQDLTIDVTRMSFGRLGSIKGRLGFANLSPRGYALLAMPPNVPPGDMTVSSLELDVVDQGAMSIFSELMAMSVAPGAPSPAQGLRAQLLDPTKPGGNLGAVLDAIERFITTPGQSLQLKLTPNETVRVNDLRSPDLMTSPGALANVLERFALDVRVKK